MAEEEKIIFFTLYFSITSRRVNRTADVVFVIFEGNFTAFAHSLQPREMNDGVDLVFLKDLFRPLPIADIRLVKLYLFTRQLFHAPQALLAGVGEIIHHDDAVPIFEEFQYSMGAVNPLPPVTRIVSI